MRQETGREARGGLRGGGVEGGWAEAQRGRHTHTDTQRGRERGGGGRDSPAVNAIHVRNGWHRRVVALKDKAEPDHCVCLQGAVKSETRRQLRRPHALDLPAHANATPCVTMCHHFLVALS